VRQTHSAIGATAPALGSAGLVALLVVRDCAWVDRRGWTRRALWHGRVFFLKQAACHAPDTAFPAD